MPTSNGTEGRLPNATSAAATISPTTSIAASRSIAFARHGSSLRTATRIALAGLLRNQRFRLIRLSRQIDAKQASRAPDPRLASGQEKQLRNTPSPQLLPRTV